MADTIGKLLKSEGDSKEISPAKSQKKLKESKRRLGGVCRSLLIDTAVYEPKKTVNSINAYIAEIEKVDRLLYSVISGFIVGLDEMTVNDTYRLPSDSSEHWQSRSWYPVYYRGNGD